MRDTRHTFGQKGFSLIELLTVIALITVLTGLLIPAVSHSRESGRSVVCKNNMRQLAIGTLNYAFDGNDYLPWAGDTDRNWEPDWVFGGQPKSDIANRNRWKLPSYGFHAEAGSIFTYVTSLPQVTSDVYYEGGNVDIYEKASVAKFYKVYYCPSTGDAGRALRVTYSMNGAMDYTPENPGGVQQSRVVNTSSKILFLNGSLRDMSSASFKPDAPSVGSRFVLHDRRINTAFVDSHVEPMASSLATRLQKSSTSDTRLLLDPYYK